jgi:predicted ABC-type ATPase
MNRLRIFAGPNGSGKSTLYQSLLAKKHFHTCYYLNADNIEKDLGEGKRILIPDAFDRRKFHTCLKDSPFKTKGLTDDQIKSVSVSPEGIQLQPGVRCESYLAAAIADAMRYALMKSRHSFAFETVMSNMAKIDFMAAARKAGYQNYLYFITTIDPGINIERVKARVKEGGHSVSEEKIVDRYAKAMANLPKAVSFSDKAYLFDNSGKKPILFASISRGTTIKIHEDFVPPWFVTMYPS